MPVVLSSSGGGSITLDAPSTAASRTLTLPDATGTAALTTQVPAVLLTTLTPVTTTSGTEAAWTGIPSGVKRISVIFNNVSLSGTDNYLVQLGSTSYTTSGYTSGFGIVTGTNTASSSSSTSGFLIFIAAAATVVNGVMTIYNISGNLWIMSGSFATGGATGGSAAGNVTLSGTLDRVRVVPTGANTFDSGSINVMYEG